MSSTDPQRMDGLTKTSHSSIPAALEPSKVKLPSSYVALVLGASRGIGEGIAKSYAQAGASTVILASRTMPALEQVAVSIRESNSKVTVLIKECDIASPSSMEELARFVDSSCGHLDAVVINSGYSGPVVTDVALGKPADFQAVTDVSYVGTYNAAHYLVPLLLKSPQPNRVFLTVASIAALIVSGIIANTAYCISKFAQAKLVEHIHEQYGGNGVLAIGIHPGAVKTEMAIKTSPAEFMQYLVDDPALCGSWCVWLSDKVSDFQWLGGRMVSANWDPDELLAKKEEIVKKDLLKIRMAL